MPLVEQRVQNAVVAELGKLDYRIVSLKSSGEHGIDILARHNRYARYFLVECKGDPAGKVKSLGSGREVRFLQGLGQIVTRMHPSRGYHYGLAFPVEYQQLVTRRLPSGVLKALKLQLFFVAPDGKVSRITWRDVSIGQTSA